MDDLCLRHLIRDVANVDHLRRFSVLILFQLHLQQAPEEMNQTVDVVITISPTCIKDNNDSEPLRRAY
jgi:hypothetical protein